MKPPLAISSPLAKWLVSLALFLSANAFPIVILKVIPANNYIAISPDAKIHLKLNDRVCITKNQKIAACGLIINGSSKGYIIALEIVKQALRQGQQFDLQSFDRLPTAQTNSLGIVDNKFDQVDDRRILTAGVNLFWPFVHFEQSAFKWLSVGISATAVPSTSVGSGSFSGWGVSGIITVYPMQTLNGFFISGNGGPYSVTLNDGTGNTAGNIAFLFGGDLGWRFHWDNGLTLGIGGGAQYLLFGGSGPPINIGFSGLLPLAMADFGFTF